MLNGEIILIEDINGKLSGIDSNKKTKFFCIIDKLLNSSGCRHVMKTLFGYFFAPKAVTIMKYFITDIKITLFLYVFGNGHLQFILPLVNYWFNIWWAKADKMEKIIDKLEKDISHALGYELNLFCGFWSWNVIIVLLWKTNIWIKYQLIRYMCLVMNAST